MADKKTAQKVLSERALELVMLNVLGGHMEMLLKPKDVAQVCNETSSCEDKIEQQSLAESTTQESANIGRQKIDQKLNS